MQVIGFNLNKVIAKKSPNFNRSAINTNIEFTDVSKEKVDLLKDSDAIKISFVFSVTYTDSNKPQEQKPNNQENQGEISFEGNILFSTNKEETKNLTKLWKKKQISEEVRLPLINFILKKCSTKALSLEEDLNLPLHIPFPQVRKQDQ